VESSQWNPAKIWAGSKHQRCVFCKGLINRGEWSKQNRRTGHVYHDSCGEDIGAYGPDFAIGGKYGVKREGQDCSV
jgi:hypothetical protein